jgi:hypothetical protein
MNKFALGTLIFTIASALYSCTIKTDEVRDLSRSKNPCPPDINIDSLKYIIREEVRQEERLNLFMKSIPENNLYGNGGDYKTNITFPEYTNVYSQPDTTSKLITSLPFASKISLAEGLNKTFINGIY